MDELVSAQLRELTDINASDPIKEDAAIRLGEIGPKARRAIPDLIAALKDQDANLRADAITALAEIEPKEAVPILIEAAIKDKHGGVRSAAIRMLKKMDPEAAVPALTEALDSDDSGIRRSAIDGLEEIGPKASAAVPALIRELKDETENNHYLAAQALEAVGPAAVPALVAALKDDNSVIRERVAGALGRIGPKAAVAVPALIVALKDQNYRVCASAAVSLPDVSGDPSFSVANRQLSVSELEQAISNLKQARRPQSAFGLEPELDQALVAFQDELAFRQSSTLNAALILLGRHELALLAAFGALLIVVVWLMIRSFWSRWLSRFNDWLTRWVGSRSAKHKAILVVINCTAATAGLLSSPGLSGSQLSLILINVMPASICGALLIEMWFIRGPRVANESFLGGFRHDAGCLAGMGLCSLLAAHFWWIIYFVAEELFFVLQSGFLMFGMDLTDRMNIAVMFVAYNLVFLIINLLGASAGIVVGFVIAKSVRE